jgi:hypothetical protein
MSDKTLETRSIPIPPHLAGLLKQTLGRSGTGFDEGAFLQQLHYWTLNSGTTGWMVDGVKWIYNSLKAWQQQFPWMSEYGLRKAIANLKKLELIQTAQHWITSYKRVMFYRIDYEKLNAFALNLCDLTTPRGVNGDQIEVQADRTSDPEISSNPSFSELQPVVGSEMDQSLEDATGLEMKEGDPCSEVEGSCFKADHLSPASSGKNSDVQGAEFPELIDAVAHAIAHPPTAPLPPPLKKVIAQFPNRVQAALSYLNQQQQKRPIKNPAGYLYEAIIQGWSLSASEPSGTVTPAGFTQWFDQARAQGLVIGATTINGVHHTLHAEHEWIPTTQMMQKYQMLPHPSCPSSFG